MSYNFDRLDKAKMAKREITIRDIEEALDDFDAADFQLSPNPETGNDRVMTVGMTHMFRLLEIGIEIEYVTDEHCIFHVMDAGSKAIEESGYEK